MATGTYSFSFSVAASAAALSTPGYSAPTCWSGTLSLFEQTLLKPFPLYPLDQLRRRFLFSVTDTHDQTKAARVTLQMAFQTEIGAAIRALVPLSPDVLTSNVCERRSFIDVDADLTSYSFIIDAAVQSVRRAGFLPASYVQMFEAYLEKPYPKYRVCALAALLCISAAYLVQPEAAPSELAAPLYPFAMPAGPPLVGGSGPRI